MKCPEYLQAFEDWLLDHNRAEKTIRNATGDMVRVMKTRKIGSRGICCCGSGTGGGMAP